MPAWRAPFQWRYTIREVRRRPLRSLLTLVGIVLGVAAVTSVHLATHATRSGYAGVFAVAAGRAGLEAVPPPGQGGAGRASSELEGIPGVKAVAPIVQAPAALLTDGGPEPVLVLGVDFTRDRAVRDYRLLEGEWPRDDGVLLEAGFARRHGCAVGEKVRLSTARGPVEVEVTGLLAAEGAARFNDGAITFFPLKRAQLLFAAPGEVSALQLVLENGADPAEVREAVEARLPGWSAREPGGRGQLAGSFLLSIEQMLGSLSAVAAVAGALVILNTFLMSLGERRRQLALLRAFGATRRQVAGLLLRQALLLGGVGTLIGLPVGLVLAVALVRFNESFLNVPVGRLHFSPVTMLLAALIGPAMTLLATLVPARRAARRAPLEEIRHRGSPGEDRPSHWPVALGLALLAAVGAFETAIVRGWVDGLKATHLLPYVVTGCLVGCACLLPAVLPALLRLSRWVVEPLLGVEGRLAVRHLSRQRARAGLTVGVLFAAVTACLAFGLSFLNNRRDIQVWFSRTIEMDFIVRAVRPDPAVILTPAALPASASAEIARLPGCEQAMRVRFEPTRLGGLPALVIAREFPAGGDLPLVLHEGAEQEVRAGLTRGEAVLGSTLASRLKVGVGDDVSLPGQGGPRRVRVCGIAKEYTVGGMALYLGWDAAADWLGNAEAHAIAVRPGPGAKESLEETLAGYCASRGFLLQSKSDFADLIYRVTDGVRGMVAGMVALVFLVAAVGVVNTLSANVIDQTREIGVLRALGMRRREVGRLVRAQALVLGVASCVPGVPAGLLLFYLMNLATPGLLGHHIPFRIDWWFVGCCAIGVMALAVVASALPARRAARQAVIDGLRSE